VNISVPVVQWQTESGWPMISNMIGLKQLPQTSSVGKQFVVMTLKFNEEGTEVGPTNKTCGYQIANQLLIYGMTNLGLKLISRATSDITLVTDGIR
jgi:acyl-coenzyme A synthetase/AMP-(fatty) acid ligase